MLDTVVDSLGELNLKYEPGRKYDYEVVSETLLEVAKGKVKNMINQRAVAHISVHSRCELSLALTDVSLRGMNVAADWKVTLEKYPLRFGFENGKVISVCPLKSDPVWAVNIKRAILSAFQTLEGDKEVDVIGECPVERTKSLVQGSHQIKSTKNVAACIRAHDISGIRSVPYTFDSDVQTLPLIQSEQNCERRFKYFLEQAKCTETHKIDSPFSQGEAVTANVKQTLTHVTTGRASAEPSFDIRSTIDYDHSEDSTTRKASAQEARVHIDTFCRGEFRASGKTASDFTELVFILRTLTANEIKSIADDRCATFVDSLATCATADCLHHLVGLINAGLVSEQVFRSFALLPNPNAAVVKEVSYAVDRAPYSGLLSLTSLVQSYCVKHADCYSNKDVQKIIDSLISKLPARCDVKNNEKEVQQAIQLLKAIGNIGYEEKSVPVINQCIKNRKNPLDLQIAAIEALRRKLCSQERNSIIAQRFYDIKENVELRLAAFHQLVECTDEKIITKLVNHLRTEPFNQVGSYVSSFFNAKQASKIPTSEKLQRLLQMQKMTTRFDNLDSFRFSKFRETSHFDAENNNGGQVDSSIIFTPSGFIPRKVSLNLTLHLYGKSYNLFEIGGRAEGIEHLHEELFGPDGNISHPLGGGERRSNFKFGDSKLRSLRDQFMKHSDYTAGKLTASYYIKMFGDDLAYGRFHSDKIESETQQKTELNYYLERWKDETESKMSRSMLLAAVTQTLPTLSGLPLQFGLNASVSSSCHHKAKLNLESMFEQGKRTGEILYETSPSMSANVGTSLVIKADKVVSGVRGTFSLHSARSFGIRLNTANLKSFSMKFMVPENKVVEAKIETRAEKIESNRASPILNPKGLSRKVCTDDVLSKVLGLRGCVEVENRTPENKALVVLEKTDPNIKAYEFKMESYSTPTAYKFKMSADTPGSLKDRKLETNIEVEMERKRFLISFKSPFKKVSLDGALVPSTEKDVQNANMNLRIDNEHYKVNGAMKRTMANNIVTIVLDNKVTGTAEAQIRAKLELSSPAVSMSPLAFSMSDVYVFEFDVAKKPMHFKAVYTVKPLSKDILPGVLLEYAGPDYKANFAIQKMETWSSYRVKGSYQPGNGPVQSFMVQREYEYKVLPGGNSHTKHDLIIYLNDNLWWGIKYSKERGRIHRKYAGQILYKKEIYLDLNYQSNGKMNYLIDVSAGVNMKPSPYKFHFVADLPLYSKAKLNFTATTPQVKNISLLLESTYDTTNLFIMKVNGEWRYDKKWAKLTSVISNTCLNELYESDTHIEWDSITRQQMDVSTSFSTTANGAKKKLTITIVQPKEEPIIVVKQFQRDELTYNLTSSAKQGRLKFYEINLKIDRRSAQDHHFVLSAASDVANPSGEPVTMELSGFTSMRMLNHLITEAKLNFNDKETMKGKFVVPQRMNSVENKFESDIEWSCNGAKKRFYGELYSKGSLRRLRLENSERKLFIESTCDPQRSTTKLRVEKKEKKYSAQLTVIPKPVVSFDLAGQVTKLQRGKETTESEIEVSTKRRLNHEEFNCAYRRQGKIIYSTNYLWEKIQEHNDKKYSLGFKLQTTDKQLIFNEKAHITATSGWSSNTQLEAANNGQKYLYENSISGGHLKLKSDTKLQGSTFDLEHRFNFVGEKNILLNNYLRKGKDERNTSFVADLANAKEAFSVQFKTVSTRQFLKKALVSLDFGRKGFEFASNINDYYVASANVFHKPSNTSVSYVIKLADVVDSEGHVFSSELGTKTVTSAQMRNFANNYMMKISTDGKDGTFALQTPQTKIVDKKFTYTETGNGEYHVKTLKGNRNDPNLELHLRTGPNDRLLKIQVTEIPDPFEFLLARKEGQSLETTAQLTLDPLRAKQMYGLKWKIGRRLDKSVDLLGITVYHPKRSSRFEVAKPSENKLTLSVQPDVNSRRGPTVLSLYGKKKANGLEWEVSLTDDKLKSPLRCKTDLTVSNGLTSENYDVALISEFSYSEDAKKTIVTSLLLKRKKITGDSVENSIEYSTKQVANNVQVRLWVTTLRKFYEDMLIARRTSYGFEHKDSNKRLAKYSIEAETNGNFFVASPKLKYRETYMNRFELLKNSHFKFSLFQNDEQGPSYVAEVEVKNNAASLEIRNEKTGDINLNVTAGMPDSRNAMVEVWHGTLKAKTYDARVGLSLLSPDLLKADLFIRPTFEKDVVDTAHSLAAEAKDVEKESFAKNVVLPLLETRKKVAEDVFRTLDPMVDSWSKDQHKFARELGPKYDKIVDSFDNAYKHYKEKVFNNMNSVHKYMEETLSAIPKLQLVEYMRTMKHDSITQCIKKSLQMFSGLSEQIQKAFNKLQQSKLVMDFIDQKLNIKVLQESLNKFMDQLVEADIIKALLIRAHQSLNTFGLPDNAGKALDYVQANYKSIIIDLYQKVRDAVFDKLTVKSVASVTTRILDFVVPGKFKHQEVKKFCQTVVDFSRRKITSHELANRLWGKYIPTVKTARSGALQIILRLPISVDTLAELLAVQSPFTMQAAADRHLLISKEWEMLNSVLSSIYYFNSTGGGIIPNNSIAYIISSKGIVTFDGKLLPITDSCTYLLAADFVNQKFYLTGTVKSGNTFYAPGSSTAEHRFPRETISAPYVSLTLKHGEHEITLQPNKAHFADLEKQNSSFTDWLLVNGRPALIPWQYVDSFDGTVLYTVTQNAREVLLETYDGIKIRFSVPRNFVEITLPGLLHGRSAGLLGTNDYEPYTDTNIFDGNLNTETTIWNNHWKLSDWCAGEIVKEPYSSRLCHHFLKSGKRKIIKDCSPVVNPIPFERFCGGDSDCDVVGTFLRVCENAGIHMPPSTSPSPCDIGCRNDAGRYYDYETFTVPKWTSTKQHYVILAVEGRKCMNPHLGKVARFAKELAKANKDAKFSWVTFGGLGPLRLPNSYYVGGSRFYDAKTIVKIAHEASLYPPVLQGPKYNITEAVMDIADMYSARSEIPESIVLIYCTKSDNQKQNPEYVEKLESAFVNVNVLTPSPSSRPSGLSDEEADPCHVYGWNGWCHTLDRTLVKAARSTNPLKPHRALTCYCNTRTDYTKLTCF